jgi:AcrR family transcriptional regulator
MTKPPKQPTAQKLKQQKREIVEASRTLLSETGPPHLPYTRLAEASGVSRQLIRYYFADPEDLLCDVCDLLAEAYSMALVNGVDRLTGPKRLDFIFDFYFDLVDDLRKPRDDQAYDAMLAYAAGSGRVKAKLRGQYTLLGQVLQLEIKMAHRALALDDCAEIGYLFVCIMYGHWKMVATLGISTDHRIIARRAIDRIIASYIRGDLPRAADVRVWS